MTTYKCIAACCFIADLHLMLNAGDTITSEQLHSVDAEDYVKRGFLEVVGGEQQGEETVQEENGGLEEADRDGEVKEEAPAKKNTRKK